MSEPVPSVPSPNVAKPEPLPLTPEERQHAWTQRLTQRNWERVEQARVDRSRRLAGGDQEALDEAMQAEFNKDPAAFLGGDELVFETPFDNVIPPVLPYMPPQMAKLLRPKPEPKSAAAQLAVLQELQHMVDAIENRCLSEGDAWEGTSDAKEGVALAVAMIRGRMGDLLR